MHFSQTIRGFMQAIGATRLASTLGACVVAGVLAGCGGSGTQSSTASNTASASTAAGNAASTSSGEASTVGASDKPITLGYSDYPTYVAWDIVEQKGFFKKNGANVKLVWFPSYTDSLNAIAAGQIDGNAQTWNDLLGPLAKGAPLKVVMVHDYTFGNDALIAQPGINSVKDLKGKKVATELGTCDHYLLLKALEASGMTEKDIQFVNLPVQDCPGAMLAKRVDAAAVWEPSRTKILKSLKGSKQLFTSADIPGLIPDIVVMQSKVIEERPQEVQKLVNSWYEMIDWWRKNPNEAVKIMAARTDTPPSEYAGFIKGSRVFSARESLFAMSKSPKVTSLHTSGKDIAEFLVKADQVSKVPDFAASIEPKFMKEPISKGLGKLPPYDYPAAAKVEDI
jgi:NitT/TauT family transport system substrate-binding protein